MKSITNLTKLSRPLIVGATVLLVAGCISTITGAPPEPDEQAAAQKYYQLGARYFHNGNYNLARDRLQRAIELDPSLGIAHSALALTYEQLDNPRLATEHFLKAVRYESGNYIVRNAYAVFLCGQERYDEAKTQFEHAVEITENDDPEVTLTNAGVCMASKPDYEQAEAYLRQALERKPSYGEALIQLALLKFRTEEFLHTRAFLQRYLAGNKATPEVLYLAVETEKALDDDKATMIYANQLLREFPDSAEARRVLKVGW